MAQFNCPGYNDDPLKSVFSFFPMMLIEFAFIFTLIVNLGSMVNEKQSKMRVKYIKTKIYNFLLLNFNILGVS